MGKTSIKVRYQTDLESHLASDESQYAVGVTAAIGAVQADVNQNEADADEAIASEAAAREAADTTEAAARVAGDEAEAAARVEADTTLQGNIDVETGRIDAILEGSQADKDNFAEIVTLINSVDTENDEAFAAYVLSNNAALQAEIDATDADFAAASDARDAIQADVDANQANIEAALAAEISSTDADFSAASDARDVIQSDVDANQAAIEAALAAEQAELKLLKEY